MPNYHSFTEDGHYCPTCKAGPFLCYMEDGQCDNNGTCDSCLKEQVYEAGRRDMDSEEADWRRQQQEQYGDLYGTQY